MGQCKMDVDELISLMDTYEIETTMICVLDNEVAYKAMQKYPGRIEGVCLCQSFRAKLFRFD